MILWERKIRLYSLLVLISRNPDHVYVTELLNTTEKKAKLIVAAILAYTGRTDETGNGSISMEPDMLRPMMQQIIREEVRKVLEGQDVSKINREMPTEVDLWKKNRCGWIRL